MTDRAPWFRPSRAQLVDLAFAVALTALALVGFRQSFGGWSYMMVGVGGGLLAACLVAIIVRLELPAMFAIALTLVAFLVLAAPIAVRSEAIAGFLPSLTTIGAVVDGVVRGWKRILTTTNPTGDIGNVLVVPYLCGFVGALGGGLLSLRSRFLAVCALPATVVLGLSILFGSPRPFSTLVQGGLFAATAVGWLALRKSRERRAIIQSVGHRRTVGGFAMLAVMIIGAFVLGPQLPFVQASNRFILRNEVHPPFDTRALGSPLNSFRRYRVGDLAAEPLFEVTGLPGGDTYIRLATMDEYDGVVFTVSPDGGTKSGQFIRIGESLPTDAVGSNVSMRVTMLHELAGPWVPTLGTVTSVRWSGTRAETLRESFRLSNVTSTGVLSTRLQAGDSYRLSAVIADAVAADELSGRRVDTTINVIAPELPPGLRSALTISTKGTSSPYQQALAIQKWFLAGYFASGDTSQTSQVNPPGHSFARLDQFSIDELPVGNDEQYAAAMALVLRAAGIPSRVVIGFKASGSGGAATLKGGDVVAWVEIKLAGTEWLPLFPTPTRPRTSQPPDQPPKPVFKSTETPPPPPGPPPEDKVVPENERKQNQREEPTAATSAAAAGFPIGTVLKFALPPLIVVVVPILVILLLKRRRRKRRLSAATGWLRIAGGWAEFLDAARDTGHPVPGRSTRQESALLLGVPSAPALARFADRATFDRPSPDEQHVTEYWQLVDAARQQLYQQLSWWGRLRAQLSLTSLRAS